ncbi:MAG TPA: pyridoxamine 5'-phosphate oxidase family protein [Pseudomonadales bacterium]|nr:pyridoxamine 5'-phosphate oxidase family protein [Pseudomonadales bacterium]
MGKVFDTISEDLHDWIRRQPMFFVASAPLAEDGHVNLSPKGLDSFRVLGPNEVAWLDLTGSGAETIAHLRENGRVTVMFCAFDGPPRIVRLYGRGEVLPLGSEAYASLAAEFPALPGARSIIRVAVSRIADSCGYAVPKMALVEDREALVKWAEKRGDAQLETYRRRNNRRSIDGLEGWPES